ncbi:hypothetical protein ATE84_2481 [Aquimarina sp. MAR_2010_214]|nr:hypothetical protein ATE84_2481 [Aquimarina sp. MAR_2010_214]
MFLRFGKGGILYVLTNSRLVIWGSVLYTLFDT